MEQNTEVEIKKYLRSGELIKHKLKEYVPAMIITNLSTLLLLSVDGIVAGNLVGAAALSSINIFYPISVFTGAASDLTGVGIATSISKSMGENDASELDRIKGASLRIMIMMAAFIAVFQIPVIWIGIRSYGLSKEMYTLTWQYATGIMLCAPLSMVSFVGVMQLEIAGKMKILTALSVMEGLANLAFDLLFVGALHMGVAGAGYGTACANLLRCSATVYFISRHTDLYKSDYKRAGINDIKEILGRGVPDFSYSLILAFQKYFILRILLDAFGKGGGVINGVCTFCFSLTNVLIGGIVGGMRPLVGLYSGGGDREGLRILMRLGAFINLVSAGAATIIIELFPQWFFALHGVHVIPAGGIMSVRLYSLFFVVKGFDFLLRMYLINRNDSKYATVLTVLGNATLPLFAFIISRLADAPFIFLAYLVTELLVLALSLARYRQRIAKDCADAEKSGENLVLYMTVKPQDAVEASREIRRFADGHGISKRTSYRVALCLEEMVAYAQEAEARRMLSLPAKKADTDQKPDKPLSADIRDSGTSDVMDHIHQRVSVEIMVRFIGDSEAIFVTLDDGKCIALDKNTETQRLLIDNYSLLKKVAKKVEYQYILNMNYTRITL